MSISAGPCLLAGVLLGLPLFASAAASSDAGVSFANGWRPAHLLQIVEAERIADFSQLECGKEMAARPGSHQRFAIVSYHPWTNPKLKAKRVVPVDEATSGNVGDHVMILPGNCQKSMAM